MSAVAPPVVVPPTNRRLTRALRHRNFRLFFFGQGLSLVGTWLTKVATYWLVYQLAQKSGHVKAATVLGIVAFVSNIPMFVIAPFCGVLVDRFNRRNTIVFTQILSMLQSGALAVLTLGGWITIPMVIGLSLFQGLVDALDTPARQSFTVEMVDDPADLANAIALGSTIFNSARLIGPAIGGLLLARFSAGVCFSVDAVSYVAVIISLLMMRLMPKPPRTKQTRVLADLREGIRYTFGFHPLRSILLLLATMSFTGSALQTLMPIFADGMQHGPHGATTFGLLMASIGTGALGGAIFLASRKSVLGLGRVIPAAALGLALAMSLFVITHQFYIGVLLCMIAGCGMVMHFASANTLLQTITEDHMRGRVMGLFAMLVVGVSPIGALLAGWLSGWIGPVHVVHIYACVAIIAALLFTRELPELRRHVRPIYIKKGILPEIAVALALEEREEPG